MTSVLPPQVPLIRVFLSSPGDVADERIRARELCKRLSSDPLLRGQVAFSVESWDDPDAPIPMSAKLHPQEAVNRGLPMPSECPTVETLL